MMDRLVITMDGSLAETGCLEEEEVQEGRDLAVEEAHHEDVMMIEEVEAVVVEEAAGPVMVVVPEEVLMVG